MKLQSFSNFQQSITLEKAYKDIELFAPKPFAVSNDTFNETQYNMICKAALAISNYNLKQYHDWLAQQLLQTDETE